MQDAPVPHQAQLVTDDFTATVDLAHPHRGLVDIRFAGTSIPGEWLAIRRGRLPSPPTAAAAPAVDLEDAYVRGVDLVATYRELPEWPIRWQVDWRLLDADDRGKASAGVELIVSAQTSLLDSDPAMLVTTEYPASDIRQAVEHGTMPPTFPAVDLSRGNAAVGGTGVFLSRLAATSGSPRAVAILVYPHDFARAVAALVRNKSGPPAVTLTTPLFEQALEKGVILRARLRWLLLDEADCETVAVAAYRQFCNAPLPLTT